jgi:hemin uptake protein HemP
MEPTARKHTPIGTASTTSSRRVRSEALLGPNRELVITHNRREYRLRLTQNGKLILTA